jgi:hypothetical protein
MNMDQILITTVVVGVPLVSIFPIALLYIKNKHRDEYLAKFYGSCNQLRDYIHSCNSKAEMVELMDDISDLRWDYQNLIPSVVLEKELQLLNVLLNKKAKKII